MLKKILRFLKHLLFFIVTLGVIAGGVWLYLNYLDKRKVDLEKALSYLKSDYEFAELNIINKDRDQYKLNLVLLDMYGIEVVQTNLIVPGKDIFIESKVVVLEQNKSEKAFVFPAKLYSDKLPSKDAADLTVLYITNDFPNNYRVTNNDPSFIETVKAVYQYSFFNKEKPLLFKNQNARIKTTMDAVLHLGKIKTFKAGKTYRYTVHPNGGLELVEAK
jgi:hypothetical protein